MFQKMLNKIQTELKKRKKKKGFTLIEMMVVVAIVAALTAVIVPTVQNSRTKAAAAANAANLSGAKSAFTTMKLLYSSDYSAWTGGLKALQGITAEGEKFTIKGTTKTVEAPNAVKMTVGDTVVSENTPMSAEFIKDVNNKEEVYVTYNGLPIAFFAEVAEKGTADANYYLKGEGQKGAGNLAANQAYIEKYEERATTVLEALQNAPASSTLFGDLITQMNGIVNDSMTEGDCIQCAMNRLNTDNMGIAGVVAGDRVENKLESMGWDKDGGKSCAAYNPVNGKDGACTCDPSHGPEAHISTTSKVNVGAGFESCPKGGVHDYQYQSHECIKCGYKLNAPCPTVDTSIPYLGQMLDGECMYCGYCDCCAADDAVSSAKYIEVGAGKGDYKKEGLLRPKYTHVGAGNGSYIRVSGYDQATVDGVPLLGTVTYETGVCMSADPLLGGSGKGCGHTAADHYRTFEPKS